MEGKAKLAVLGDKPLVAETQAELLDDNVTPTDKLFIRNNGQVPDVTGDPKAWKVKIDGEVNTPMEITRRRPDEPSFPAVTYQLMLECGGNGRCLLLARCPRQPVDQRRRGLPDVDRRAPGRRAEGRRPEVLARSTPASYGADPTLAGDTNKPSISRGVPIAKAMEEHTLIAFKLNGQDLPLIHGAPVRLVVPGWAGSSVDQVAEPHLGARQGT